MSEYPPRECTCDQLAHPCEIHDCTGGETDQGPPKLPLKKDGSAPVYVQLHTDFPGYPGGGGSGGMSAVGNDGRRARTTIGLRHTPSGVEWVNLAPIKWEAVSTSEQGDLYSYYSAWDSPEGGNLLFFGPLDVGMAFNGSVIEIPTGWLCLATLRGPSSPDPDPDQELDQVPEPEPASDPGEISDGYHTFRELYDHRHALWCAFASTFPPEIVWKSRQHDRPEVPMFDGYFIAGAELPSIGQVTYHLPDELWDSCPGRELERALPYDGHDSAEVVRRLRAYAMDVMINDVW